MARWSGADSCCTHLPGKPPSSVEGKALFVIVAGVEHQKVVGLLTTRELYGGVDFIVTAAAARGKGVATAAVKQHIESALRVRGLKDHEVEVLPSAIKFWSKLGYKVAPGSTHLLGGGGSDGASVPAEHDDMRNHTTTALARAKRRLERQPVTMRL